ncbi:MAG: hypothetical protein ACK4EY_14575 [Flavipsychrobacter sp.]
MKPKTLSKEEILRRNTRAVVTVVLIGMCIVLAEMIVIGYALTQGEQTHKTKCNKTQQR